MHSCLTGRKKRNRHATLVFRNRTWSGRDLVPLLISCCALTLAWHFYRLVCFEMQYRPEHDVTSFEENDQFDTGFIYDTSLVSSSASDVQKRRYPPQKNATEVHQPPQKQRNDGSNNRKNSTQKQIDARYSYWEHRIPRIVCYEDATNHDCLETRQKGRKIPLYPAKKFEGAYRGNGPYIYVNQRMCKPVASWQKHAHSNCNAFHEEDIASGQDENRTTLLGSGGWRMAWKVRQSFESEHDVILKTLKWDGQDFDELTYHRHAVDAIATEHLTASKHIIDIYGFCGESSYNEVATTSLKDALKPLLQNKKDKWKQSLMQRVGYARDAALAVAQLYDNDNATSGFATIVHHDIKPDNFVLGNDGTLKLNDFNDGELIKYNTTSRGPCLFRRARWSPYYRSIEQAHEALLTPAVDVWALGSVFHFVLTGNRPYGRLKKKVAFEKLVRGELAEVPSKYTSDVHPAVVLLVKLIRECWSLRSSQRPLARDMAAQLSSVLEEMQKN